MPQFVSNKIKKKCCPKLCKIGNFCSEGGKSKCSFGSPAYRPKPTASYNQKLTLPPYTPNFSFL